MLTGRRDFRLTASLGACLLAGMSVHVSLTGDDSAPAWKLDPASATRLYLIEGTGFRANPVRRKISPSFSGEEIFVRYRLRYAGESLDTPEDGDGEFFVLWLDDEEGGDSAAHSGGVPNAGLHVEGKENRFMVRFGPGEQKFAEGPGALQGGRDYLLLARLWKSNPGAESLFDQLDLWIDPKPGGEFSPDASVKLRGKGIASVEWIGFSTGQKTEPGDRISIWDVKTGRTWESILDLPPKAELTGAPQPAKAALPTIDFAEDVYPILKNRCLECHRGDEAKSKIRLDSHDEVLNQISLGQPENSRLIELVSHGEMPPPDEKETLPAKELKVLRTWIEEGAAWDEALLPIPVLHTDHWSFQPLIRPNIPEVKSMEWVRTPVDAFIAAKHEEAGLVPAPPAAEEILRRRLSLDLLGLPPLASGSFDVEKMLESTAYGERWGRHWLDVARWAESNGHQHNRDRPHAWRYRDWVIEAFRNGLPFDQFLRAQIAGDLIATRTDAQLIATGFSRRSALFGKRIG